MLNCRESSQEVPYMNHMHKEYEERCKRDIQQDLKSGIDLLFDFKKQLSKLHPGASESLLRMVRDGF
jgi:hypothetical protein